MCLKKIPVEKIDDGMIDYQSVNEMDNYYADTFKEYVDSFSPSGNIFNTTKKAQIKLNKEVVKREDDALNWEEQFRGGSLHGFNIGGAVNKLKTVGSLTKGLKPAKTVGNISKGQMKLPKPQRKDLSGVFGFRFRDLLFVWPYITSSSHTTCALGKNL